MTKKKTNASPLPPSAALGAGVENAIATTTTENPMHSLDIGTCAASAGTKRSSATGSTLARSSRRSSGARVLRDRSSCCRVWWRHHGVCGGSLVLAIGLCQVLAVCILIALHVPFIFNNIARVDCGSATGCEDTLANMRVELPHTVIVAVPLAMILLYMISIPLADFHRWHKRHQLTRALDLDKGFWAKIPLVRAALECTAPGSGFFAYYFFFREILEQGIQFANLHEHASFGRPMPLLILHAIALLCNSLASFMLTKPRTFDRVYRIILFEALSDTFYSAWPLFYFIVVSIEKLLLQSGEPLHMWKCGERASRGGIHADLYILLEDAMAVTFGGDFSSVAYKLVTKCFPLLFGIRALRRIIALDMRKRFKMLPVMPRSAKRKKDRDTGSVASSSSTTVLTSEYQRLPKWAAASFVMVTLGLLSFSGYRIVATLCPIDQHPWAALCLRKSHPIFTTAAAPCICADLYVNSCENGAPTNSSHHLDEAMDKIVFADHGANSFLRSFLIRPGWSAAIINQTQVTSIFDRLQSASTIFLSGIGVKASSGSSSNATISIPSSIGAISDLKLLYLHTQADTQLAALPSEMGRLSWLIRLHIDRDTIGFAPDWGAIGATPPTLRLPTTLGRLTKLVNFEITRHRILGGLPNELSSLTFLKNFKLVATNVSLEEPAQFGQLIENMVRLSDLQISYSAQGLVTIPSQIGRLTNLYRLSLHANSLSSISSELYGLSGLGDLNLQENRLTRLSSEIGKLTALARLRLDSNRLTAIPIEIASLSSLEADTGFDLMRNRLTEIPHIFAQMPHVKRVFLTDNKIQAISHDPQQPQPDGCPRSVDLAGNPVCDAEAPPLTWSIGCGAGAGAGGGGSGGCEGEQLWCAYC